MFEVLMHASDAASTTEPGLLAYAIVFLFFGTLTFLFLRPKLYICPECHYSNDWDHVAEVTEESPYCPYCGTHTKFIGRRYQCLLERFTGDRE